MDQIFHSRLAGFFHTSPGPDAHAGADSGLFLRPSLPDTTRSNGGAQFNKKLLRRLQHGPFMAYKWENCKSMGHKWPASDPEGLRVD